MIKGIKLTSIILALTMTSIVSGCINRDCISYFAYDDVVYWEDYRELYIEEIDTTKLWSINTNDTTREVKIKYYKKYNGNRIEEI